MKGSTHLAVGVAIGAATAWVYSPGLDQSAIYVGLAAFSALIPDLDGPSMLSSKLSKWSKRLRQAVLWGGALGIAATAVLYFWYGQLLLAPALAGSVACLLGFIAKAGIIRNMMASLIGAAVGAAGWTYMQPWLIGLGVYIAWAPWLKHRGLTHSIWAVLAWGWIADGLQQELLLDGVRAAAVAGYCSHLLTDMMTPKGVKLFQPLMKKAFKLPGT